MSRESIAVYVSIKWTSLNPYLQLALHYSCNKIIDKDIKNIESGYKKKTVFRNWFPEYRTTSFHLKTPGFTTMFLARGREGRAEREKDEKVVVGFRAF